MSATLASNAWGEIIHHPNDGILELRWLPTKMTDAAFKATLALLALEAERVRQPFLLIDATQFRHQFGPGVMEWRDACIIPRYGAAGAKKFAGGLASFWHRSNFLYTRIPGASRSVTRRNVADTSSS